MIFSQNNQNLLFVCGCPRSGTSAVTDWLVSSEKIAIGLERYQKFWREHLCFPDDAFNEQRFFDVKPDDTWYKTLDKFPEHYLKVRKKWQSAAFIGDKIPSIWKNLSGLFSVFPQAKVIYTYRDPFSIARSYKIRKSNETDMTWGRHRDVSFAIQKWNESISKVVDFFNSNITQEKTGHNQIFVIKYEEFINNFNSKSYLDTFLGCSVNLPNIKENLVFNSKEKPEVLSEIEKDLIWTLLDTKLIAEMQSILDSQRLHFIRLKFSAQSSKRRQWYHTSDLKDAGINYGEFEVPGCGYVFRGRQDIFDNNVPYAACIGSATTFGRFLHSPYPEQLEKLTGIPIVNLGIGGARPESYLVNESLLNFLRKASFVIIEVMSARGYQSSFFEPNDPAGNMGRFIDFFNLEKYAEQDAKLKWLLSKTANNESVFVDRVFEITFKYLNESQRDLIRDELVIRYCSDIRSLIKEIRKPVVALFMSKNKPYQARQLYEPKNYEEWSGTYPHFIDEVVLKFLEQLGVTVVVSRSQRGFPYIVKNWLTGEPAAVYPWQENPTLNTYYPSQEMHDDAVVELLKENIILSFCINRHT